MVPLSSPDGLLFAIDPYRHILMREGFFPRHVSCEPLHLPNQHLPDVGKCGGDKLSTYTQRILRPSHLWLPPLGALWHSEGCPRLIAPEIERPQEIPHKADEPCSGPHWIDREAT
jgi:hypothetical protein